MLEVGNVLDSGRLYELGYVSYNQIKRRDSGGILMRPETVEWLRQSEYDIGTAEAMYSTGRYVYTAFMCQLATEKVLKGLIVERTGNTPPKTHNLIHLAKTAKVEFSESQLEFIAVLNMAGVGARYPDMLDDAIKRYPKEVAWDYMAKTKEVIQWLERKITSTQ